uniref:Uncharacterized protein n=1 Tax=Anguilla anguilla TaxID=7936 RepID=A0A0E9UYN0_ANGAN
MIICPYFCFKCVYKECAVYYIYRYMFLKMHFKISR